LDDYPGEWDTCKEGEYTIHHSISSSQTWSTFSTRTEKVREKQERDRESPAENDKSDADVQ
jgi:hypothetical protein